MSLKTLAHLAHYGSGAVAIIAGVLASLGVSIPGIMVDPGTAILFGVGIIGSGAKADLQKN